MVRGAPALLVASALLAGLVSCGGSDEGGLEPKRTVDARNEAVRFFPADTPFVALVDPTPGDATDPSQAVASLETVPPITAFLRSEAGFAARQGLGTGQLVPLLDTKDPTLGTESTQIALGQSAKPDGSAAEPLIVVVTDDPGRTNEIVRDRVRAVGLRPAGGLDRADLYEGDSASLAVRDGVILVAPSLGRVKEAIRTRDSDPDLRLDDGLVDDALEELPPDAAVKAYVDVGELAQNDPGVGALASGATSWIDALGPSGIGVSLSREGEPTEIRLVAAIDSGERSKIPVEERPERIQLDADTMNRATTGGQAGVSGFRDALLEVAPSTLSVSATDDEVRALLVSDR